MRGSILVSHASEVSYVYGWPSGLIAPDPAPGWKTLSPIMMDYWISFATSLDPNDGKGSTRACCPPWLKNPPATNTLIGPQWPAYDPASPKVLQLKADDVVAIPDDYRKEQISLILANPAAFGR